MTTHAQNNEDVIAMQVLQDIGITHGFVLDIGANTKHGSNTRLFLENGWQGLRIDGEPDKDFPDIKVHWMTRENIVSILEQYGCPKEFELLSIDIDGNDFWILNEILAAGYSPKLIVAEINPVFDRGEAMVMQYNPEHQFEENDYYGMSFRALEILGHAFAYSPIMIVKGLNAFLLKNHLINEIPDIEKQYVKKQDWPKSKNRAWIEIGI